MSAAWPQQPNRGYYRFPAIHGENVVFTAEGDLWQVGIAGGTARRLTTHPGEEVHAAFSPDGKTIAFSANYEGPTEVYTMPAAGGLPVRRTYEGGTATVVGWTPDGKILYATARYSTLPDIATGLHRRRRSAWNVIPLSQAAEGCYDAAGQTLFFTRLPFQGSHAKRYQGGTAQNLWKYTAGQEAAPLTADYAGTSKNPMWWNGRVYFLSDRDGTMNLWSMDENGKNLKQHTQTSGLGRAVARRCPTGRSSISWAPTCGCSRSPPRRTARFPIGLASDFDQLREHWIKKPLDYITAAHLSPDGSRVVADRARPGVRGAGEERPVRRCRGSASRAAIATPASCRTARTCSCSRARAARWSSGRCRPTASARGEQLTHDGKVLRWEGVPSPDGKWIAHQDKDHAALAARHGDQDAEADRHRAGYVQYRRDFEDLRWSPDSRWLAFARGVAEHADADHALQRGDRHR